MSAGDKTSLKDLNTVKQVAVYWGISERTVKNFMKTRRLGYLKLGHLTRITKGHVVAFEEQNERPAIPPEPRRPKSMDGHFPVRSERQVMERLKKILAKRKAERKAANRF